MMQTKYNTQTPENKRIRKTLQIQKQYAKSKTHTNPKTHSAPGLKVSFVLFSYKERQIYSASVSLFGKRAC